MANEFPESDALLLDLESQPEDAKDKQIANLQEELLQVKDHRREDWFFFIFFSFILLNLAMFSNAQTWSGPLAVLLLEVLFLGFLATRLGIEGAAQLMNGLLARLVEAVAKR